MSRSELGSGAPTSWGYRRECSKPSSPPDANIQPTRVPSKPQACGSFCGGCFEHDIVTRTVWWHWWMRRPFSAQPPEGEPLQLQSEVIFERLREQISRPPRSKCGGTKSIRRVANKMLPFGNKTTMTRMRRHFRNTFQMRRNRIKHIALVLRILLRGPMSSGPTTLQTTVLALLDLPNNSSAGSICRIVLRWDVHINACEGLPL